MDNSFSEIYNSPNSVILSKCSIIMLSILDRARYDDDQSKEFILIVMTEQGWHEDVQNGLPIIGSMVGGS